MGSSNSCANARKCQAVSRLEFNGYRARGWGTECSCSTCGATCRPLAGGVPSSRPCQYCDSLSGPLNVRVPAGSCSRTPLQLPLPVRPRSPRPIPVPFRRAPRGRRPPFCSSRLRTRCRVCFVRASDLAFLLSRGFGAVLWQGINSQAL